MIGSLANYSNTIPAAPDAAADGDAKPAQPAARMGKLIGILDLRENYSGERLRCGWKDFGKLLKLRNIEQVLKFWTSI
jgi:hypothetical protein